MLKVELSGGASGMKKENGESNGMKNEKKAKIARMPGTAPSHAALTSQSGPAP